MSRDPAAKWILETERPDLIANWFKNRASDDIKGRFRVATLGF
jgi:hypothetical protein